MIYLNRGYFYPMLIILSIAFLPFIVTGTILVFSTANSMQAVVIAILTITYFILIWLVFRISRSSQYYLISHTDHLEICYPNLAKDEATLVIENKNVIQFDYCRLLSIKSWFLIPFYDIPQCVFMTFMEENEEVCKSIGYMTCADIQALARKTRINLVLH